MIIRDIQIEGFGKFSDYRISGLDHGVTVFFGRNEAGKSTLRNFITRIMFGFPDRRSNQNLYEPFNGGRHGGSLVLSSESGEIRITRTAETRQPEIILPEGSTGTENDLARLLGYTGIEIFSSIYSFGTDELSEFSSLSGDGVRDRIYSAGAGTGAVSIAEVQKELEKKAGELYSKRGSKPVLNDLFRELKEIDLNLRQTGTETARFDGLHTRLKELDSSIDQARALLHSVDLEHEHLNSLFTAWQDWVLFQSVSQKLKDLPDISSFPENGLNLLDGIIDKQTETEEMIDRLKQESAGLKALAESSCPDTGLIKNGSRIRELLKGEDKYRTVIEELPRVKEKLKTTEEELTLMLKEIGSGWDEQGIDQVDMSIPVKRKVREQQQILAEAVREKEETGRELTSIEHELEQISAERTHTESDIGSLAGNTDESGISALRKSTVFLRNELPALKERERSIQDQRILLSSLGTARPGFSVPGWAFLVLFGIGIFSLIVSESTGKSLYGIILFAASAAPILAVFFFKYLKFRNAAGRLNGSPDGSDRETGRLREELLEHARKAGFDSIPDLQLLAEKEQDLLAVSAAFERLKNLREKQETSELNREKISARFRELREKEEEAEKNWKEWLISQKLDPDLDPETVLDIFSMLKNCVEKKKNREELKDRVSEMETFARTYEAQVSGISGEISIEPGTAASALNVYSRNLIEAEEASRELARLEKETAAAAVQLEQLGLQQDKLEKELKTLLEKGGAFNAETFRKNGMIREKREHALHELEQHAAAIRAKSGSGEAFERFRKELLLTSREELEVGLRELKTQLNEQQNILDELLKEKGGVSGEITRISKQDENTRLRFRKSQLLEQAGKASKQWALHTLTGHIIRKAVKKYEKERQPDVIKESQEFFNDMTQGKYPSLYAQLSSSGMYIEDGAGRRKETEYLSTGTAQQLYLAVRFGLIRELNKRSAVLPAVFDDIMVHFDDARITAASQSIGKLAMTNQVLYFTCHEQTRDILADLTCKPRIIDLEV